MSSFEETQGGRERTGYGLRDARRKKEIEGEDPGMRRGEGRECRREEHRGRSVKIRS